MTINSRVSLIITFKTGSISHQCYRYEKGNGDLLHQECENAEAEMLSYFDEMEKQGSYAVFIGELKKNLG